MAGDEDVFKDFMAEVAEVDGEPYEAMRPLDDDDLAAVTLVMQRLCVQVRKAHPCSRPWPGALTRCSL